RYVLCLVASNVYRRDLFSVGPEQSIPSLRNLRAKSKNLFFTRWITEGCIKCEGRVGRSFHVGLVRIEFRFESPPLRDFHRKGQLAVAFGNQLKAIGTFLHA